MDYSSYTEAHHQQQFQHPEQQQQQQAYDSSQLQAYDHSTQAYYAYNPHQQPQASYDQYAYYHSSQDYSVAYAQQQSQQQFHQEPTSIHPPGVPIPPASSQSAEPAQTHLQRQQNAYYPHGAVESRQQSVPGSDVAGTTGGLNPAAAVAAISQFTHFAGSMDASQSSMHPPIGQTPYRGGGRRGSRPFRGGGRGHFGYRGPRPDGSAASFHGRGRGQGGSRHFTVHGAVSTNPNSASAPAEGIAALMQPPSASVPGQAPLPVPAQVPPAPFWQPPRMAWCELCRVDCNTLEILEQHKNGKRHKKNLKVHEELQKLNKVITGQQNEQMPNAVTKPDVGQSEKVEGLVENQPLPQKLASEVVTNNNVNETEQQNDTVDNSEASVEPPEQKSRDQLSARRRGSKRKMRGRQGGKYMRANEGLRRPVEPPKPKQVIPLICGLCNVKCESQVVFDSHLTGKKHLSNLKRFHGHRALYGEAGLQALYPPNFNAPSTSLAPQVQQGANDPQVLLAQLLMTYVLSQAQASGVAAPQGAPPTLTPAAAAAAAAAAATISSFVTQNQSDPNTQGQQLVSADGNQNGALAETSSQQQSVVRQSKPQSVGNTDTKTESGTSELAEKEIPVLPDNSVVTSGENSGLGRQVAAEATLPVSQCEAVVSLDRDST
ncbi:uncharacterized protein LOC107424192 [Ziziphus jujuba]|uniref:Uncharacterized protein LOC107424192 n=1 Tax=Ziziphus jujuba TaxID=326968 RepID=A0A6P4AKX5_ZIZJJ|nr:uncharacterized protein LOC107424192 [Ziziphus jujuba]